MRKRGKWLVIIVVLVLGACSPKEEVKHVEAFMIHTYEEFSVEDLVPGQLLPFEPNGYVKVNSVTEARDWGSKSKRETLIIEDFYNIDGIYLNTLVSKITSSQSTIHNSYTDEKIEWELSEPSTILLDGNLDDFSSIELSLEERQQVEEHVKSMVRSMEENEKNEK